MVAQLNRDYVKRRPYKALVRMLSYALFEGRPVTTRGRWINPLVFAHFGLEARLPQLRRVVQPVFILGTGRSGTTILGVALSMHRQVGYLNEPKALWHAIHPGEDVIGSYSRQPGRYRLGAADADAGMARRAHRLFGAYLAATGSARVVDKYPELVFRVPFVRRIFPDARFVLLTRDGNDTVGSIQAWSRRHRRDRRGQVHDWWGVDGRKWTLMRDELVAADPAFAGLHHVVAGLDRQTDMAAVEWIVTMREVQAQRHLLGRDATLVRYEDLAARPREVLGDVALFCGLADDETYLAYGSSILRPGRVHDAPRLHARLRPLFAQTLRDLGY